jgi:hypothetical protein
LPRGVAPYEGSLLGLRRGGEEVTFHPDELGVIVEWSKRLSGPLRCAALPVAEYSFPRWGRDYRWTALADRAYWGARAREAA